MSATWESVLRRREEGDSLMKGGNYRGFDEIKQIHLKCPRVKCQSSNISLNYGYCICHDCNHAWKRRI